MREYEATNDPFQNMQRFICDLISLEYRQKIKRPLYLGFPLSLLVTHETS